ncbi:MAG: cytochrome b/b6 domain-containing protein [Nevskiales bacterium]|nr:cytochrome b/b6 domain-containing protein [Nevskiales bacterium]
MSTTRILVWDIPTRVFHWLLAISFAGAYITAESESWRLVHVTLGYSFAGLILFRLVWGLIGTRHARFSDFAFGPKRVVAYLRSLLSREPEHHVGHNPAGSWAIYAILLLGLGIGASGYALYNDIGGEAFEEIHEVLGNLVLGIVVIHVAGVLISSFLHRENLPRSMVTGYKDGEASQAISGSRAIVGAMLAAAVLGFWLNAFGIRESLVGAPVDVAAQENGHGHDAGVAGRYDDDDDDD